MSSSKAVLGEAVLHALGRRLHRGADIDRPEVELHRAGIDGGEIENVVDDRQQRVRGDRDVAEIFALLRRQRTGRRIAEEVREADDVGERRAQLVGHVMDEIDLDLVGVLQRLVALAQRALDVDRVGDVLERHQRGAVGQRHRGAVDHAAVAAFEPSGDRLAAVDRGDARAQRLPDRVVAVQRPAQSRDRLDVRPLGQNSAAASRHMRAKAGLGRRSRPSLPNTATPSVRLSSVSPCTRISSSKRRSRSSRSVTSSNR